MKIVWLLLLYGYIRSLAARMSAVSHNWVYQCCLVNKLLPPGSFSLPCGINLQGNIIDWSLTTGHRHQVPGGRASFVHCSVATDTSPSWQSDCLELALYRRSWSFETQWLPRRSTCQLHRRYQRLPAGAHRPGDQDEDPDCFIQVGDPLLDLRPPFGCQVEIWVSLRIQTVIL